MYLVLNLPSDNVQGIIRSEGKTCHNSSNTTNLIQSILLPCVYPIEYALTLYPIIVSSMLSLGYTVLYLVAVYPTPHLHATPTPWEAY